MAGWLSVCPPESASAVMSSAIGIRVAHSACSGVISPFWTSSRRNRSGGGAMNLEATSTRETLAMIRLGATIRPDPSRRRPATRYRTTGMVRFRKAEASTRRTRFRR